VGGCWVAEQKRADRNQDSDEGCCGRVGITRVDASLQAREGGYDQFQFRVDCDDQRTDHLP
jgi:hypothetical protein